MFPGSCAEATPALPVVINMETAITVSMVAKSDMTNRFEYIASPASLTCRSIDVVADQQRLLESAPNVFPTFLAKLRE